MTMNYSSEKKTSSTSTKKIRVLNKYGKFVSTTSLEKAKFSVKRKKSVWIDSSTIQFLYDKRDERIFKRQVWERDNYTCQYCGEIMHPKHELLTVDHVIPKHLGGSILPDNMVCCCKPCNQQKGHRTFEQYLFHLYLALSFMILLWNKRGFSKEDSS